MGSQAIVFEMFSWLCSIQLTVSRDVVLCVALDEDEGRSCDDKHVRIQCILCPLSIDSHTYCKLIVISTQTLDIDCVLKPYT